MNRQGRQERQEECHSDRSEAEWRNLSAPANCRPGTGDSRVGRGFPRSLGGEGKGEGKAVSR
jgi:hypothetical protein